jgi:hypothetical protein
MAEVLRCEHCASRDLSRINDREYTCNHCKSRILLDKPAAMGGAPLQAPLPTPLATPRPAPRPNVAPGPPASAKSPLRTVGTVLFILLCAGVVVALKVQRAEQRQDRARRLSIQRSVEASLSGRFRAPRNRTGTGESPASEPSETAEPPQHFGAGAVEPEKRLAATFNDLTPLPDSIGNIYFVGLYKNTGEATIDRPQVEITLLDANKKKLSVAHGYGAPSALLPGEETPVKILVAKAPPYDVAEYKITPERHRYGSAKHYKLSVEGPRLSAAQFGGYDLTGTLRNKDSETVQHVQLIILLRDAKNAIVGLDNGFLGQKVLPVGDESPFRVHLSQVRGKPTQFSVYTSALAVR